MATPKRKLIVRENIGSIHVYYSDLEFALREVSSIEGILSVLLVKSMGLLNISINPLYDIKDVAKEIGDLLGDKNPDVFADEG